MSKVHNIKIAPRHYADVMNGTKKAELRFNDRGYKEGDTLVMREWGGLYTGEWVEVKVTHVLFFQADITGKIGEWAMLSFEKIASSHNK